MSSPMQWEAAAEILDWGKDHPALERVGRAYGDVFEALDEARKRSKSLQKVGVGHTEDPTLVVAYVVRALRELAEEAEVVATQMEKRLGGA